MKKTPSFACLRIILAVLCLLLCIPALAGLSRAADDGQDTSEASAEASFDERVDPTQDESFAIDHDIFRKQVPGVGSSFAKLLDQLILLTTDTTSTFQQIFANYPLLLPDLYKVFITL